MKREISSLDSPNLNSLLHITVCVFEIGRYRPEYTPCFCGLFATVDPQDVAPTTPSLDPARDLATECPSLSTKIFVAFPCLVNLMTCHGASFTRKFDEELNG
jgi:hypothetical protein